jgi:peptidyl-prolyl cis-trans isomerase A (cyclophilin A)
VLAFLLAAVAMFALTACESQKPKPAESKPQAQKLPDKGTALIETKLGTLRCELFPKETPSAVNNFIGLAEGTHEWKHPANGRLVHWHLYDGTVFHRVIPGFMIQGGDPAGTGAGGPGYKFQDELRPELKFDKPGRLAYANEGPNTNGSQFFVTEAPAPHLNGRFTIFGQCDDASVALVKKIARMPRDKSNDRPNEPVKIEKVTIERG